jgi:hypothetical protein
MYCKTRKLRNWRSDNETAAVMYRGCKKINRCNKWREIWREFNVMVSFQQGHCGKGLGPHVNTDAHGGARVPLQTVSWRCSKYQTKNVLVTYVMRHVNNAVLRRQPRDSITVCSKRLQHAHCWTSSLLFNTLRITKVKFWNVLLLISRLLLSFNDIMNHWHELNSHHLPSDKKARQSATPNRHTNVNNKQNIPFIAPNLLLHHCKFQVSLETSKLYIRRLYLKNKWQEIEGQLAGMRLCNIDFGVLTY